MGQSRTPPWDGVRQLERSALLPYTIAAAFGGEPVPGHIAVDRTAR